MLLKSLPKIQSKGILLERTHTSGNTLITVDQNLIMLLLRRLVGHTVESASKGDAIGITLAKNESEMLIHFSYPHTLTARSNAPQLNFKLPTSEFENGGEAKDDISVGLYAVKSLVEFMGGKMRLASEGKKGDALSISFPNKSKHFPAEQ